MIRKEATAWARSLWRLLGSLASLGSPCLPGVNPTNLGWARQHLKKPNPPQDPLGEALLKKNEPPQGPLGEPVLKKPSPLPDPLGEAVLKKTEPPPRPAGRGST